MAIPAEAEGSNYERLMKWWVPAAVEAQSDGTSPGPQWSPMDKQEEDDDPNDPAERVYQISAFFHFTVDDQGDELTSEILLELLDELQGYVVSIDVTKELHSVNALEPLLYNTLYNEHAVVRAKVAEVVTTMVQNNPTAQQLVIETDGLPPLLHNLSLDPDETSRTKALCAIYALIRNNKPGITAFRLENGYVTLRNALMSETGGVTFEREALNLIQYLQHENSSDCNIVTKFGFPCIIKHLTSSDDAEVRKAASYLNHLLELLIEYEDKRNQALLVLLEWIGGNIAMAPPDDPSAAKEERRLLGSLQTACYMTS